MNKAKVQSLVDELYRTHTDAVAEALYLEICDDAFKLAFHILDDYALAEDVAHDSTSHFINEINSGMVISDPIPYVRKMTRNIALDYIKKRKWEISSEEIFYGLLATRSSYIEEEVEAKILSEQLLGQLREDEQEVLWLYLVDQYTHKQIAQMLHCPESTVRNKYSRSLKKLRAIEKQQENGGEADAQSDQTRDRGEAAEAAQGQRSAGVQAGF